MRAETKKEHREAVVFADGGCVGNPGPGGWAAVVLLDGVYSEYGGSDPSTTNNRMEMTAVIEGLSRIPKGRGCAVVTDSKYVVDGASKWIHGWKRKGWIKSDGDEVLNRDLWERIDALSSGRKVVWEHVRGHAGHPQNERCDEIANGFARGLSPELKTGGGEWIFKNERGEAYPEPLYLSCVDGAIEEHGSWAECEARIKGVRGSKCKKVKSRAEHIETLVAWEEK